MTTEYTINNAYLALPHLVHYAKTRRTVTYSELADKIGRHWRVTPHVLAYIRDEICIPRGLPLITAIVVNKATQMPGRSWLPEGTDHLSPGEYRREYEDFRDQAFACATWDALLDELGLSAIKRTDEDLNDEGLAYAVYLERRGRIREADPHRALKEYVADHPTAVGLDAVKPGEQEYLFVSGDRCDVVFDLGENGHAVVEIKKRERGDLIRGVYQALKCRALMGAEKGHGEHYPVSAHLVAYDIPHDIAALAERLDIRCHILPAQEINGHG